MNWENAALVATVISPLVASAIFAGSVAWERRTRRRDHLAHRIGAARAALFTAGRMSLWPGALGVITGWQFGILSHVAELALAVPKRQRKILGPWLLEGAAHTTAHEASERARVLGLLIEATTRMDDGNRGALKAAEEFAAEHPWPKSRQDVPRYLRFFAAIGSPLIQLATRDRTFGRARSR